jgi:hypothetical protein
MNRARPYFSALISLVLGVSNASALASADAACPFVPEPSRPNVIARVEGALNQLRQACEPSPKLEAHFSALSTVVLDVHNQLRSDVSIPASIAATDNGMPVSCNQYGQSIAKQRRDALRRLEFNMSAPQQTAYSDCLRLNSKQEQIDCIHTLANERLQSASRYCNARRTSEQAKQLQSAFNDSFRAMDSSVAQVLGRLPEDCADFKSRSAQINNAAVQLTTSLAATVSILQPMSQASGLGIVLGANLLKHASNSLLVHEPTALSQFKKYSQFPAKACLVYELQQKHLACEQQFKPTTLAGRTPGLSKLKPGVLQGSLQPGVADLMVAMQATEAATQTQAAGVPDFLPALDELSRILDGEIANPRETTKQGNRGIFDQRIPTIQHLRDVALDLKKAGADTKLGPPEREALLKMSTNMAQLVDDYSAYRGAAPGSTLELEKKRQLLTTLSHLSKPVGNAELYSGHPAAGIREALDKHWELFIPPTSGLTQWRRHEYRSALVDPLDAITALPDPQISASYQAAKQVLMDDIQHELVTQRSSYDALLKQYQKTFDAGAVITRATLEKNYTEVVRPLLKTCSLLAASFHFAKDEHEVGSAPKYRDSCKIFECNGRGLAVFDSAVEASDKKQDLHAMQCRNSSELSNLDKTFFSRFTRPQKPVDLCGSENEAAGPSRNPLHFFKPQNWLKKKTH